MTQQLTQTFGHLNYLWEIYKKHVFSRGWWNVDPVYRVGGGGGPPEALKFFVTLSDKNHSNGLQH